MKTLSTPILLLALLLLISYSCKSDKEDIQTEQKENYTKIFGKTMGTSYSLVFKKNESVSKSTIDSILVQLNLSLSTYIDSSTISKINNAPTFGEEVQILVSGNTVTNYKVALPLDQHFVDNYKMASEIYYKTNGDFDPTVMPLVNYWGFGTTGKIAVTSIDSQKIKELRNLVGFDKANFNSTSTSMTILMPSGMSLDFSALAKGYAVDYLSQFLRANNLSLIHI